VSLSNAELLALAVLKGDRDAACALADCVQEEWSRNDRLLEPVQKITVPLEQARVVVFFKEGATRELAELAYKVIREGFRGGWRELTTVGLIGVERIEVYELPVSKSSGEETYGVPRIRNAYAAAQQLASLPLPVATTQDWEFLGRPLPTSKINTVPFDPPSDP
jgi:hypothetical protein